jgi:hypothetical protein
MTKRMGDILSILVAEWQCIKPYHAPANLVTCQCTRTITATAALKMSAPPATSHWPRGRGPHYICIYIYIHTYTYTTRHCISVLPRSLIPVPEQSKERTIFSQSINLNGKILPVRSMKTHRRSGGTAPVILSLCPFTHPAKNPGTHWIGGWVGPRTGRGVLEKRDIFCVFRDSNPGHYSDYDIPAVSLPFIQRPA